MTLRVLALTTLPTRGAGNRLRIEQYVPYLKERGVELEVSAFFDDHSYPILYEPGMTIQKGIAVLQGSHRRIRDLARARRYGLVLVYRETAPLGPPILERALGRLGVPYVLDFDDAIFLGPIHPVNRRWAWLRHPSRVAETTRRATAVMVQNEYLAQWARRWNDNVMVVPSAVDVQRHRPRADHEHARPTVIGWVGSSTTSPYLRLLDDALAVISSERDVVIRVIGGPYSHSGVRVESWPFSLRSEPRDVATFDIGVLPEPDDPWTRGKGALKAMIYMATSIPVVASRVGVNSLVVPHGRAGYCASTTEEWVEALRTLIDDPALRTRMGRAGRDHVVAHYSIEAQGPRIADVLMRAASQQDG